MKILFFKTLASTQTYLKELLATKPTLPLAIVADTQTDGLGSRNNSWVSQKGNLFLSFALRLDSLPSDLKLESASIYYSYILKETLVEFGSKVFVKWPNDLYLKDAKVAGMITNIVGDTLVCGVGLNLQNSTKSYASLDIEIPREKIVEEFLKNIEKKLLWKQVFSKYKLEFYRNQNFFTHFKDTKLPLSKAVLENDGSLSIEGERIYSLR